MMFGLFWSEGWYGFEFHGLQYAKVFEGTSRQIFSLQYQYKIKLKSDENKEKYQLEDPQLIQYQIL